MTSSLLIRGHIFVVNRKYKGHETKKKKNQIAPCNASYDLRCLKVNLSRRFHISWILQKREKGGKASKIFLTV